MANNLPTEKKVCKTHGAVRMTPAQAAGIEASAWTVSDLIERCGE